MVVGDLNDPYQRINDFFVDAESLGIFKNDGTFLFRRASDGKIVNRKLDKVLIKKGM